MSGLLSNVAIELFAGALWVLTVALGMWIENRFDLFPRRSRRNKREMAMVHSAHKYIRRAEREKMGCPGMEKMDYAVELFQRDFAVSYLAAYDLLSEVFTTTELYHNGAMSLEADPDYNE